MQPLRNTLRKVPKNIHHRISKPRTASKAVTTTSLPSQRTFTTTPATMSLFPRFSSELAPLFRLMDDYDRRIFRDLPETSNAALRNVQTFTPKFDVREVADAYELHGEFPGIEQKDINIEWTDANTLTVSGRHEHVREEGQRPTAAAIEDGNRGKQPRVEDEGAERQVSKTEAAGDVAKRGEGDGTKYWVSERSVGEFHRSFSFPARVDQDGVKASLKNGVLSVVVPKAKAAQPRRVAIE
ncbi:HSP20-like chaperone [Byssothecium circinans]|uniref:HSP20-like chaperone n=1 Tax=Byssothecium circinans TaxID=147558 RepID=A0A6A5TQI1_9PLEO|nr:HSP20-like chaperone [Byssothecium circinans]